MVWALCLLSKVGLIGKLKQIFPLKVLQKVQGIDPITWTMDLRYTLICRCKTRLITVVRNWVAKYLFAQRRAVCGGVGNAAAVCQHLFFTAVKMTVKQQLNLALSVCLARLTLLFSPWQIHSLHTAYTIGRQRACHCCRN